MNRTARIFTLLLFASLFLINVQSLKAQNTHYLTFDDLANIKRINNPKISPDSKWIAYTVSVVDKAANKSNSDIWIVPAIGGEPRQLTSSEKSDSEPCWSPNSQSIAFVSNRDGSSQIWTVNIQSKETTKLTNFFTDISGLTCSSDGKMMAFTSEVYPDCPTDECNQKKFNEAEKSKVKAKITDHLLYRHWTSWKEGRRNHIFVVPSTGGAPKDVTPGDYDAPPFSLGGFDYEISPDSSEIAFVKNLDKVEAISTNKDIFIVPTTGGEPKLISASHGMDTNPRYSPDGKYIAWLSMATPGFEADRNQILLYDRTTKQIEDLTKGVDFSFDDLTWAPDSKSLYLSAEDKGKKPIFQITIDGKGIKTIYSNATNGEINISKDGNTLFFSHSTFSQPSEIYSLKTDGTNFKQITHENDKLISQIKFGNVEEIWFEGAEKTKVHGFVVKPPQFEPGKKYPMIYLIHGGPQGAWTDGWGYRWNSQKFASPGYVVVMVNPRGSMGYGQQFTNEISGDWGGKVYEDLMRGVDHAISLGYVDPDRIGAAGASYGGYMVNWILGHTDRFKALVSHAGVYNLESMYGVTEELWFPEWEFKGTPWNNPEMYAKWSPNKFAKNFKTPTLVTHGELDYRVPVGEGLQLFTALQRQGVPSKLLCFPDEGHWISKPQNGELWDKTVQEWFANYLLTPKKN